MSRKQKHTCESVHGHMLATGLSKLYHILGVKDAPDTTCRFRRTISCIKVSSVNRCVRPVDLFHHCHQR